jgi:hypothetical protein
LDRYLIAAGLFAVAGALLLGPLLSSARAQGTGFSQCISMPTEVSERVESIDKRVFSVPAGWTPVGGGVAWTGTIPRGGILLCR